MLYEITIDCRINNKDYKKWDIVSNAEVEYFPSVMRPFNWDAKPTPKVEKKPEKAEENHIENDLENGDEEVEDEKVEEKKEVKTSKKRSKKK